VDVESGGAVLCGMQDGTKYQRYLWSASGRDVVADTHIQTDTITQPRIGLVHAYKLAQVGDSHFIQTQESLELV
jgi:hypothetical protein